MKSTTNATAATRGETLYLTVSGVNNPTVTITYNDITHTYIGNELEIKIPAGVTYTISFSEDSELDAPESVTYIAVANNYRALNVKYIKNIPKDLSLMDIYGNPISRSTANCYVVSKPGKYMFPLVYGNAIKNGNVNYAAFTNNGGLYSYDFIDGLGEIIYSPKLTNAGQGLPEFSSKDVENMWDYFLYLGQSFDSEYNYITFEVTNIPSEGANVIISYMGDAIIWNWHIWLWPHDLSPIEITNSTGVKYNIMPVNLASKYDSDKTHIKNWFYQWGRMTPLLCPSAFNSNTNHSSGTFKTDSKLVGISSSIANPTTFYYISGSPYNWFGNNSYYNLWDAACTITGNSDNDTVKTVYDPCPVGWKVPNGNVFTGFSTSNVVGSFADGWKFKRYSGDTVGVFFPASGLRDCSDGSLSYVGLYGYVWLSSARSQTSAYHLDFSSSGVTSQGSSGRAYGFSVRPVTDKLYNTTITFSIGNVSYNAWDGMTWFEWVNSSFNTGGFVVTSNGYINNTAGNNVESATSGSVITSGRNYRLTK